VFTLAAILKEKGLDVIVGRNGEEGLRRLRENRDVDLVFLSIGMSDMNGDEVLTEIREMDRKEALPIFAMTSKIREGEREEVLRAGASEYFTKPLDIKKMLVIMKAYLEPH
jgi:DNA-binding response OmpR family regulator